MKTKMFVRSALMACGMAVAGLVASASAFAIERHDLRLPTETVTNAPGDVSALGGEVKYVLKMALRAGTNNAYEVNTGTNDDLVYVFRTDGRIDNFWSASRDEFTKYNYSDDSDAPVLIETTSSKLSDQSPDQLGIRFAGTVSLRELLPINGDNRDIPAWLALSADQLEELQQLPAAESLTTPEAPDHADVGGKPTAQASISAITGHWNAIAWGYCWYNFFNGQTCQFNYQGKLWNITSVLTGRTPGALCGAYGRWAMQGPAVPQYPPTPCWGCGNSLYMERRLVMVCS
jgi:hypothetical protein